MMSKVVASTAVLQKPTKLKCVLAKFERTIGENIRVGVSSGMYLSMNAKTKPTTSTDLQQQHRHQQNLSILATLDEATHLTDLTHEDNKQYCQQQPNHETVSPATKEIVAEDGDEIPITSFHSGCRRSSKIMSRTVSVCSDDGGGSTSSRSSVSRSSLRIRELPRDILIGSFDDDDDSDSDSVSDDDENMVVAATTISLRHW